MTGRFSEQAVLLGRSKSLVGIVTRPADKASGGRPAVIILNTGIVHRVGHHRMYVDMARLLAAAGHSVLRFDLSGIGDSDSRADGLAPLAASLADIREAVDWLTSYCDSDEVVLLGLCAGADRALRYGHTDPRVVGLALLDPPVPPTLRFYLQYIGQRLTRLRSWMTFASGRGRLWQDAATRLASAVRPDRAPQGPNLIDPRDRAELERIYRQSADSGVQLLAVLTNDELAGRQTYREQLLDGLPDVRFGDRLRLEFFEGCDHTFSSVVDRKRLNEVVAEWIGAAAFGRVPTVSRETTALKKPARANGPVGRRVAQGPGSGPLQAERTQAYELAPK